MCEQLRTLGNALGAVWLSIASAALAVESPGDLAHLYRRDVDQRLEVPAGEQRFYAEMLEAALRDARVTPSTSQYVLLVDRNANVQAIMLFWRSSAGTAIFIGASPTSTGRPGGFEHFETPTGVFAHTLANLDFRAEGTENEFGVPERTPTPWSGRYLIIVDSGRAARPGWLPVAPARR